MITMSAHISRSDLGYLWKKIKKATIKRKRLSHGKSQDHT